MAGVVSRIRAARLPVLPDQGLAAVRANASASLARLAEALGCPVVVAPMAKGVLAEDHPLYAGTLDMACNAFMWEFLAGCDLIVAAGFDAVELIKPWSLEVPTIHVDSTPNTDQIYPAEVEIVGPVAAILEALADSCAGEAPVERGRGRRAQERAGGEVLPRRDAAASTRPTLDPRRRAPRHAAGDDRHRRRGLAQDPGGPGLDHLLAALDPDDERAVFHGLLAPRRDRRQARPPGAPGRVLHRRRRPCDGARRSSPLASLGIDPLVIVFCDNSLNRIELKQAQRKYPSWGLSSTPLTRRSSPSR